jgi:hypothetical protein
MISFPIVVPEFVERALIVPLLEITQNPTTDDAFNKLEDTRRFSRPVSYQMHVIRHDDVGEQKKAT